MKREERYKQVIEYFLEHRPVAETELVYTDPYELAVAVILSAQCTDKRVNITTPAFFAKFPTAFLLSKAKEDEVFKLIKSCTFPNNKARSLIGMAKSLTENFNGIIPSEVSELMKLPGIGRKSANVLASVIYKKPAMAVDTHVFRVSERIGLTTDSKNPLQTELTLVKYIPEHLIPLAHHWLILHGRYICIARKPRCHECGLTACCRFYQKIAKEK